MPGPGLDTGEGGASEGFMRCKHLVRGLSLALRQKHFVIRLFWAPVALPEMHRSRRSGCAQNAMAIRHQGTEHSSMIARHNTEEHYLHSIHININLYFLCIKSRKRSTSNAPLLLDYDIDLILCWYSAIRGFQGTLNQVHLRVCFSQCIIAR